MPDIESMIKTQRVLCIKKFLETSSAGWKFFLESYLKKVGGKFLFQCNLYQIFVSKISSIPTAMKKYDKAFNTDTFHLDWEKIYLLPFKKQLCMPN